MFVDISFTPRSTFIAYPLVVRAVFFCADTAANTLINVRQSYESVKYSFFSPHVTRAFQFFMTNVFQDILLEILFYFRCMRGFPCIFQFYLELFSYIFTCFRGVSLIFYELLCLFRCMRETRLLSRAVLSVISRPNVISRRIRYSERSFRGSRSIPLYVTLLTRSIRPNLCTSCFPGKPVHRADTCGHYHHCNMIHSRQ